MTRLIVLAATVLAQIFSVPSEAAGPTPADTIYIGEIVTMAGAPGGPGSRVEAVAVAGERIIAVGSKAEVMRHRAGGTRVIELGSSVLLPGFIDAHGHLTATATASARERGSPGAPAIVTISPI